MPTLENQIWTGKGWEVRQGRWQDSPPESVDHVISDPPYSAHVHRHLVAQCRGGQSASFDALENFDHVPMLLGIASRWVLCFCALEDYGRYEEAAGGKFTDKGAYVRGCAWLKPDGAPQFSSDRPAQWGEGIACLHKRGIKLRWNGGGNRGVFKHLVERDAGRFHETQKPLSLLIELIELFTDPGDLVWDPYGGSMTTGVACLRLGRRFLGHEMQEHYARQGAERLRAEENGLSLPAARAGQQPLFPS